MAAAICAGVLVTLLFLSYIMSSGLLHRRSIGITLPTGDAEVPVTSTGSQLLTAQNVADVEITTDNVRNVIASLSRPDAYSCIIENRLYYAGGSSSLRCRRYVRDGLIRTDTLTETGSVRSSLMRRGDTIYSWNADNSAVFEGSAGNFSDDAAAMLPTYEDVLADGVVPLHGRTHDHRWRAVHRCQLGRLSLYGLAFADQLRLLRPAESAPRSTREIR